MEEETNTGEEITYTVARIVNRKCAGKCGKSMSARRPEEWKWVVEAFGTGGAYPSIVEIALADYQQRRYCLGCEGKLDTVSSLEELAKEIPPGAIVRSH